MADNDAVQDGSSLQEQTGAQQTSGEPTASHPGTATIGEWNVHTL